MAVDWGDGGWQWFLLGSGFVLAALIIATCLLAITGDDKKPTGPVSWRDLENLEKSQNDKLRAMKDALDSHKASTNPHQHYGDPFSGGLGYYERVRPGYNKYTGVEEGLDRKIRKVVDHELRIRTPFLPENPDQI